MNIELLNALKQIVAKEGEIILSEPKRVAAFLSDLAKDVPKPQRTMLVKCLEYKSAEILKNAFELERTGIKQKLAQKLNEEELLDLASCKETLDLLEAVLFGEMSLTRAVPPVQIPPQDGSVTTFIEKCTKSYGLGSTRGKVVNIIFKDTAKPVHKEIEIRTATKNQTKLVLSVYENNSFEEIATIEESTLMYEICEIKLTPGLPNNAPIKIVFDLDNDGILAISAKDITTNVDLPVHIHVK